MLLQSKLNLLHYIFSKKIVVFSINGTCVKNDLYVLMGTLVCFILATLRSIMHYAMAYNSTTRLNNQLI